MDKQRIKDLVEELYALVNEADLSPTANVFALDVYVDGSVTGANPGNAEWRVSDSSGNTLVGDGIGWATNNLAEFCGLVEALMRYPDSTVWSDSVTAIAWVRKAKANTKFHFIDNHRGLGETVRKYERWLKQNPKSFQRVKKWNTKQLGEIPADFGRK